MRPIERLKNGTKFRAATRTKSESAGVFDKELTFFGKEEIEPGQVHLLLIDLDLRKVRTVRGIECERWCQAVLNIDSAIVVFHVLETSKRLHLAVCTANLRDTGRYGTA